MTKDQIIAVAEQMPSAFDVDQFIERLIALYYQQEVGLQNESGQPIPLDELKQKLQKRRDEASLQSYRDEEAANETTAQA